MISAYDAGWVIDPEDAGALEKIVAVVLDDPDLVRRKKENARTLAREVLDPSVAVGPLLKILGGFGA